MRLPAQARATRGAAARRAGGRRRRGAAVPGGDPQAPGRVRRPPAGAGPRARRAGPAHPARAGGARPGDPRTVQRRDRARPRGVPQHGQDPRHPRAGQARAARPGPRRGVRVRARPDRARAGGLTQTRNDLGAARAVILGAPWAKGQATSTDANSGWLRRLSRACWRYPRNLVLALGGTLVVSLVGITIPLIQRAIVDNLTSAAQAAIWPLALALIVAAAANFAGLYVRRYRGGRLSLDVQHDLRTQLFSALSRLDGTRQDELHTGQIVSRSISDLTMVQALLSMLPLLMGNLVLFVGSLVAMAFLSPTLTLIALAVGPALWFVSLASRRKLF